MNLVQSIRHGAKWLLFGSVGGTVIGFAIGIVLARLLTPADFGMIVTVQIFTGLAGLVAGGGMGQALIREKDVDVLDLHAVFTLQLLIGFVIYAGFFVAAPFIAQAFGNPLYSDLVRVSAVSFLLRPLANIPSVVLNREMRFKPMSIFGMILGVIGGVVSILMAWSGWGVWSLVISGLFGSVLSVGFLSWYSGYLPRIRLDAQRWRRFAAYGFKMSSNDIVIYVRNQSANSAVSHGLGAAAIGLYNKGDSLASLPYSTITTALYEVLFRGLSKVQDDLVETRRLYLRAICLLIVYTLPISVGMAWLSEPFIRGVFGDKWTPAAVPMAILAASGLFTTISNPTGAVLAAQNMLGRELVVQVTFLAAMLVGVFVGMNWGLAGVAIGVLVARAICAVQITRLLGQRLPLRWRDFGEALGPGLALSACVLGALCVADVLLPASMSSTNPLLYTLVCVAAASLVFGVAFLFLPLEQLSGESARWRRLLRLTHA